MIDEWVMKKNTKECWRLDTDSTKEVYIGEDHIIHYKEEIWKYQFYPMCPKEAPKMEVPEHGRQMTLEDFIHG